MSMENSDELLNELHRKTLAHLTPIIAMMATMSFIGIVGNSFAIGFYGFVIKKRTPSLYLITALAWTDLAVSVVAMIPDIIETVINVNFTSDFACKVFPFCQHVTTKSGILILGFIAIDRYRHVCCPFQKQVTDIAAKWIVGYCVALSIIWSSKEFVTAGTVNFPVNVAIVNRDYDMNGTIQDSDKMTNYTAVIVHGCATKEGVDILITTVDSVELFTLIMTLVVIFISYSKIAWAIKTGGKNIAKSNKRLKDSKGTDKSDNKRSTQTHSGKDIHTLHQNSNDSTKEPIFTTQVSETISNSQIKTQVEVEKPKATRAKPATTSKAKGAEKSITLMMGVISIIFACCFIPYFYVQIGLRSQESSQRSAGLFELGLISQLVTRLPYVNSIVNPFVFCLFNPSFRAYMIKKVLGRN